MFSFLISGISCVAVVCRMFQREEIPGAWSPESLSLQCCGGVREVAAVPRNYICFSGVKEGCSPWNSHTCHAHKYSSWCTRRRWSHKKLPEESQRCEEGAWMPLRESTASGSPRLPHLYRQPVRDMKSSEQADQGWLSIPPASSLERLMFRQQGWSRAEEPRREAA